MSLPLDLVRTLQSADPKAAWTAIFEHAWETCRHKLNADNPAPAVLARERAVGEIDQFLATAGWDLWRNFDGAVDRTADALAGWWTQYRGNKAILILDGLSLREVPWLLQGAEARGYTVHQARPTACELPGDTNTFAKALGVGTRGALENNKVPGGSIYSDATTDATETNFADCANAITAAPRQLLWHHWPDNILHGLSTPGQGLSALAREAAGKLSSDAFWSLVAKLTHGRRLVITSDHGYGAIGEYPDTEGDQKNHLKAAFGQRRFGLGAAEEGPWTPPIVLTITSRGGTGHYALGRRKWAVQGGNPTLAHGGLTVLEVASPFIEISRSTNA